MRGISMRGQVNYILIPFLILTAVGLLVIFKGVVENTEWGLEESHMEMIKARGFGGEPWKVVERHCNDTFSTYFVEINASNSSVNGRAVNCRIEGPFHCRHCVVVIRGDGENITLERWEYD